MLGSIYSGMSGLVTYSKGLDVISNNVANLNTPGFKGEDLTYRDLFYQIQWEARHSELIASQQDGSGVGDTGSTIRFRQGDLQETGNETDVAIDGNGFFVIQTTDGPIYTRAGQFNFDEDGFLITVDTGERVAGLDENGELIDISLEGLRTIPPTPTGEVSFVGNLSTGSTRHVIDDLEIIDRAGNSQPVTVTFINNGSETSGSWLVEVEDEQGNPITVGQEIRFQGNGSPAEDFNSFTFEFPAENAEPFEVTFYFGEPGSFTNATSFSGGSTSDLIVEKQDGRNFGSLISVGFTRTGTLELEYSNGETEEGAQLALAWFDDLQLLVRGDGARFAPRQSQDIRLGVAGEDVFGEVRSETVEISNIELTQEFTDLIIVQRGFQASSQVITVANEMMQQLLDMGRSR